MSYLSLVTPHPDHHEKSLFALPETPWLAHDVIYAWPLIQLAQKWLPKKLGLSVGGGGGLSWPLTSVLATNGQDAH